MSQLQTDLLIIGGGVAGLTLALQAADQRHVMLVRPSRDDKGASRWAQGGIAATLAPEDSFDAHVQDTLIAGDGLCDEKAVRFTVENSPAAIQWLIDQGVPFTPDDSPDASYPYHLTKEGGHSARRIIHADDATGKAVIDTLHTRVSQHPNIVEITDMMLIDLLGCSDQGCLGAYLVNDEGASCHVHATETVLATGGASGIYRHTTTPSPNAGESMMMAARLGATLMNLEFQQFHPTCLYDPEGPAFLISEAVRGEGGRLINAEGRRFMPELDTRAELAPRDIVARAIDTQIQTGALDHVWLDVSHLDPDRLRHHFPTIHAHCLARGIDITFDPIPVVPAAHYSCGGIATDLKGDTGIKGLYAIGEVACTGLHGANRMASNSLLECLVFAQSCARHLLSKCAANDDLSIAPGTRPSGAASAPAPDQASSQTSRSCGGELTPALDAIRQTLRDTMSQHLGIVRHGEALATAARALISLQESLLALNPALDDPQSRRLHHTLSLARMTVLAAQRRRESRGLHYATDWPAKAPIAKPSCLQISELSPDTTS